MSDAERIQRIQRTIKEAANEYQKLPSYLKEQSARPQSASIDRTVRPESETLSKKS